MQLSQRCAATARTPASPLRATHKGACRRPVAAPAAAPARSRHGVRVQALFGGLFGGKKAVAAPVRPKRPTIVPQPSYNIPITLLAISAADTAVFGVNAGTFVCGILGTFLAVQASRVKFVFDDEALEVVVGEAKVTAGDLEGGKETENVFVGGKNRWSYDTFINWEFWWPGFPVLVYFKESQTKPEGQIHFFPIIFNGKELYDVMVERCGSTMNSGPK